MRQILGDPWSFHNSGILIPVSLDGLIIKSSDIRSRWPGLADAYRRDGLQGRLSRAYWGSGKLECNCGKSARFSMHHSWCDSRGLPPAATCLHFYVPQVALFPAQPPADSEYYKLIMFPVSRLRKDKPDHEMIGLSLLKLRNLMELNKWSVVIPIGEGETFTVPMIPTISIVLDKFRDRVVLVGQDASLLTQCSDVDSTGALIEEGKELEG